MKTLAFLLFLMPFWVSAQNCDSIVRGHCKSMDEATNFLSKESSLILSTQTELYSLCDYVQSRQNNKGGIQRIINLIDTDIIILTKMIEPVKAMRAKFAESDSIARVSCYNFDIRKNFSKDEKKQYGRDSEEYTAKSKLILDQYDSLIEALTDSKRGHIADLNEQRAKMEKHKAKIGD